MRRLPEERTTGLPFPIQACHQGDTRCHSGTWRRRSRDEKAMKHQAVAHLHGVAPAVSRGRHALCLGAFLQWAVFARIWQTHEDDIPKG